MAASLHFLHNSDRSAGKWERKRRDSTIVKWLFICMLGGLTLCPLVNGRIFFSVHFNDLKVKKITIL